MRLLLTAFFFEAGLVLLIVPWSIYWEQNYFVQALPVVQTFITNDFVRGAVSGLGLVNLLAGLVEIWAFLDHPTICRPHRLDQSRARAGRVAVRPVVCMITDRRRLGRLMRICSFSASAAAAAAGVDLVQVRERDMEARALSRLVGRCLDAARGTRTRVLVNDRLDVALAAGAHGVHLRSDSMPAARARSLAPIGFLIGRSVHSAGEAVQVSADGGVDYLLFGAVFATASKPGQTPAGVQMLADVAAATPVPVLAVGGMTERRCHSWPAPAARASRPSACLRTRTTPDAERAGRCLARLREGDDRWKAGLSRRCSSSSTR